METTAKDLFGAKTASETFFVSTGSSPSQIDAFIQATPLRARAFFLGLGIVFGMLLSAGVKTLFARSDAAGEELTEPGETLPRPPFSLPLGSTDRFALPAKKLMHPPHLGPSSRNQGKVTNTEPVTRGLVLTSP